jgi:hypothetical protein
MLRGGLGGVNMLDRGGKGRIHLFAAIGTPRPWTALAIPLVLFTTFAPPKESMSRIGMLFPTNSPSPAQPP